MYGPTEVPFLLGHIRACVNPPLPAEIEHLDGAPAYMADGTLRVNREALVGHYDLVLREVVRLTRLAPTFVDTVLQEVRRRITEPD